MEGRVVPIRDPFAPPVPSRTPTTAAADANAAHLIAATVRLTIADPGGRSTGTGSIVDARNGMALVLTCGHLFRESKGQGPIEITLFTAGPGGAEARGTVAGELYCYDLDRDLALVRFRADEPVAVTPIAPPGAELPTDAPVTSVGCDHGANPTAWATHVTSRNRYQGFPNVEAARAPVEGRSGGGLFNSQGQLIGVCFAADPESNEGLYAAFDSIHAKLDELQLASVYRSPAGGDFADPTPPPDRLAAAAAESRPDQESIAVRGQSPTLPATLPAGWPPTAAIDGADREARPQAPRPSAALVADAGRAGAVVSSGLTPQEQATLEEIAQRSAGAEVICIIRPQSPEGRSEVVKLSGVTPAFVRALMASAAVPADAAASQAPDSFQR
jgi:S1-C subfamily serine protease